MIWPTGKYQVIYADPPWEYRQKKTGRDYKHGAAQNYDVMSLDKIKLLPVREIAERDAVLFLWATVPLLPEAFDVMKAWGFKYKTMITWRKIMSLGLGYWFRGQTEHLLFGIQGKVKAFHMQRANFIQIKVIRHSEKPEEFRQLIEESTINLPGKRIELFARQKMEGWDVWGNECEQISVNKKLEFKEEPK